MRVLAVTKIFPNALEPHSAPFNRQQLAALSRRCEVEVLATIPWFPGLARDNRAIPRHEVIDGLAVGHPRTLYLPRVGHALAPALYLASIAPAAAAYRRRCDVVLGSWAYPDGVAAIALARLLGVPAVVKLHGSDLNVVAELRGPRAILRRTLPRADAVIAVSRALAERARDLGVDPARVHLVMNGVDGEKFRVRDRAAARAELGLDADRRWLLYVGNLKESKGVLDLLAGFEQAAGERDDLCLAIIGGGAERPACEALAARLPGRVMVAGPRPLDEVPVWMAACDLLVLPSWAEGTPNVVLEALACGRRVVATAVGGVPDVVAGDTLGELVEPRRPEALAAALVRAAARDYDPVAVAAEGSAGDWDQSAGRLYDVLAGAVAGRA